MSANQSSSQIEVKPRQFITMRSYRGRAAKASATAMANSFNRRGWKTAVEPFDEMSIKTLGFTGGGWQVRLLGSTDGVTQLPVFANSNKRRDVVDRIVAKYRKQGWKCEAVKYQGHWWVKVTG